MPAARASRPEDSTRRRIMVHLRRGASTVEEMANAVGTSDNAVRSHLSALERDGLVKNSGVRRGAGVGKPATLYELTASAELAFSRAYPSVLTAVLDTMVNELGTDQAKSLLRYVGDVLATTMGGAAHGDLRKRANAAAAALNALGGDVDVHADGDGYVLQGHGCPLSATVARRPEACHTVESLVAGVSGATVHEECAHGDRPQCRFRLTAN